MPFGSAFKTFLLQARACGCSQPYAPGDVWWEGWEGVTNRYGHMEAPQTLVFLWLSIFKGILCHRQAVLI